MLMGRAPLLFSVVDAGWLELSCATDLRLTRSLFVLGMVQID